MTPPVVGTFKKKPAARVFSSLVTGFLYTKDLIDGQYYTGQSQ